MLATGLVFLYHSGRAFDDGGWHVKNPVQPFEMIVWEAVLDIVIMPLFFVLSGISIYYALGAKSGGFVVDKIKRLLVPLTFGIFVLSPHMIYLERLSHGQTGLSFVDWLPQYFNGPYLGGDTPGNFAWMGVHLWYLLFLLLFSLLTLPLFRYLRGAAFLHSAPAGHIARPLAGRYSDRPAGTGQVPADHGHFPAHHHRPLRLRGPARGGVALPLRDETGQGSARAALGEGCLRAANR